MVEMEYTRGERLALWVADHSPRWLLEQPERIVLNVILIVVGLSVALPPAPQSVVHTWPDAGRYLLAGTLIAGAVASLIGTVRLSRAMDRFGALALFGTCTFISFILFSTVGLRAFLTGVLFAGIAGTKLFRFIRATAVRIRIRHHLIEEKARMEETGEL